MVRTTTVLLLSFALSLLAGCATQGPNLGDLPPTASAPTTSDPGFVEARYFDNIGGTQISDLTGSAGFPDNPDTVQNLTSLESGSRGDSYGSWVRGFIVVPATGDYRFFVSGDDQTQFLLSPSDQADQASVVASVTGWTTEGDYTKYTSQTSAYQQLTEGQPYYFEIRHKEGGGGDHFSVAWEGPGITQQVIGAAYLYSWSESGFGDGETIQEAYSLGYRVGYLDGSENLAFSQLYPPLDQDGDGLYDNWEIVNNLDPNDPNDANNDPDGDLIPAADEFLIGTSENTPDSDGDGIPDGYEYAAGLNPLDAADANADLDGDGYSNLEEYQAGTSVTDAGSNPKPKEEVVAGFIGQYYRGMSFDEFVGYQEDLSINFDLGSSPPHPDLSADRYSIRWTGTFVAPHTSGDRTYRFDASHDDGARLALDGTLVVDDWRNGATRTNSGSLILAPQEAVSVSFEFYEDGGRAVARLRITDASTGDIVATDTTVTTLSPESSSTEDTDGDGIPDAWELKYGLNALSDDANETNNASGVTNLEAFNSGLHPFTLLAVSGGIGGGGTGGGDGGDTTPVAPEPTVGTATISWTAPSTRRDGSSLALSEIKSYLIKYGASSNTLDQSVSVPGDATSATIEGLTSGTWYFTVQTEDTAGLLSPPSEQVTKTLN